MGRRGPPRPAQARSATAGRRPDRRRRPATRPQLAVPQGKAILAALARTGHHGVSSARQGKHFDIEVDDSVSDEDLGEIAGSLLANPVIETWTVTRVLA